MFNRAVERQYDLRLAKQKFASYIAAPATGTIVLPAGTRFAIRPLSPVSAGTLCATVSLSKVRQIHVNKNLLAGQLYNIDFLERSSTVTISAGFDLLVGLGLDNWAKVAGA